MEKQEILEALKNEAKFAGLDIQVDERVGKISVFGFSNTPDWQACKAGLAEMGFEVMASGARFWFEVAKPESIAEKFAKMTPEQQAAATAQFNQMVTGH